MPTESTSSTKTLSQQVAANIRAEMGRQSIRQTHLAARMGVNDVWVSVRLKKDHATPIGLDELPRFADALSQDGHPVTVADLLPPTINQPSTGAASLPIVMPGDATRPRPAAHRPSAQAISPHLAHRHAIAEHSRPSVHAVRVRPAGV